MRLTALLSGQNLVSIHHAAKVVERHMAVKQPDAGIVRNHVRGKHLHRRHEGDIGAHLADHQRVSMPVRSVEIEIVDTTEKIPADAFALFNRDSAQRHAAVGEPVDGEPHEVRVGGIGADRSGLHLQGNVRVEVRQVTLGVPTVLFVSLRKQNYQFTVHVFRRAIRLGLPSGCYDHRAHQPRAGIAVFVGVRVVHPHDGVAVPGSGSSAVGNLPGVGVRAAGRDRIVAFIRARSSILIGRAF